MSKLCSRKRYTKAAIDEKSIWSVTGEGVAMYLLLLEGAEDGGKARNVVRCADNEPNIYITSPHTHVKIAFAGVIG